MLDSLLFLRTWQQKDFFTPLSWPRHSQGSTEYRLSPSFIGEGGPKGLTLNDSPSWQTHIDHLCKGIQKLTLQHTISFLGCENFQSYLLDGSPLRDDPSSSHMFCVMVLLLALPTETGGFADLWGPGNDSMVIFFFFFLYSLPRHSFFLYLLCSLSHREWLNILKIS